MDRKEILMVVLIGILLITTAIQTIQLVNLGGAQVVTVGASTSPGVSGQSSSGSVPTNLQDLPSMVGGC